MVVGISADPIESHQRFRASLTLPFNLVADTDKHIMSLYGVRRRLGFLPNKRVTYIVHKDGTIAGAYHHEMSMRGHVEDVLEGLRRLNAGQRAE